MVAFEEFLCTELVVRAVKTQVHASGSKLLL